MRAPRLAPLLLAAVALAAAVPAAAGCASALDSLDALAARLDCRPPGTIRVATYNASLNRGSPGQLARDLATGGDAQARRIAAVLRRVRPDVLLVNEFDHDAAHDAAALFARHYLESGSGYDSAPLRLPQRFTAPVNTGVPSGLDLDRDGRSDGPGDALGFGAFPGQYGMVVYSRFPIDRQHTRTFQQLRWSAMPDAALPPGWYSPEALARLPLSSKSHWDLPIGLPGAHTLHLLASHPTPPAFDGPEDRNGRRNHDEIRFWADYLSPESAGWIVDDRGRRGGLEPHAAFVVLGDLNADPVDTDGFGNAIRELLEHPRIDAGTPPRSAGAIFAAQRQGGANLRQRGDAATDTADFGDTGSGPGNLRADYVLPARDIATCNAGVFWPRPDEPESIVVDDDTTASSDHRLVWIDIALDAGCAPAPFSAARSRRPRGSDPTSGP